MSSTDTRYWYDPLEAEESLDFQDFVDSDVPTVVVKDRQLEPRNMQARAQLRSVTLFQTLGFETVLHSDDWDNQFKLVEYGHVSTNDIDDVSALSFPIVHVVTQEGIEKYGEERVVRRLFERSIEEGSRYVLVTDTVAPKTPSFTKKPGKSIVDEYGDTIVRDYNHLSSVFIEEYLDSHIPVVDTRNVFFHVASTIHQRHGVPAGSIDEVFDYTKAPTNSPVWESARYFLEHNLENVFEDYSDRLQEALRSWTERGDTRRVANHILEVLQVCDYDSEQFEQYRNRDPDLR